MISHIRMSSARSWRAPALLAMAAGASSAVAQTTLTWNAATNGLWSDTTHWSPNGIPNNAGPNTFNAVISLAGAYTVNFNIDATIQNFTLNGAGSIMQLANNCDLTVNQNMTLGAEFDGRQDVGGNGTLRVNGNLTFTNGARLRHTTSARVDGNIIFANSSTDEICDTGVDHRGASMLWNGSGDINLGRAASITLSSSTVFTINSAATMGWNGLGATGTIFNGGQIVKASAGTTFFNRVTLNNASGGTVKVTAGILKLNQVANFSGGMLTGGRYRIEDGGQLQIVDLADAEESITTNDATIELVGATSRFDSLNTLTSNTAAGTLTVSGGRSFTTGSDFTNSGTLNVGEAGDLAASSFTVASGSALTNYNLGTHALVGGVYNLRGVLQFDGASIQRLEADLTLDGANSAILSEGGTTAFDGALTIASAGALSVRNRTFTTAGDLTNDGKLTVGAGATVEVQSGTLTNIVGGALTGGTYDLAGALIAGTGQSISTIDANVTFDGAGAQILAGAADALADWTSIGANGVFSLKGASTYVTQSTANFTVASTGKLAVEAGSEFQVRAGSDLTNFSGGVFSGGQFEIQGRLRFQNAAFTRIDNDITLDGQSSEIVDFAGNDAFLPLNHINTPGRLTIKDRAFTVANNLAVDGELIITQTTGQRAPAQVTVNGDVNQTGTLTLDGGTLVVLGDYNNFGAIRGNGAINANLAHHGAFSSGAINSIELQGTLSVESGSVWALDLGQAALGAGLGFDQFLITSPTQFAQGAAGRLVIDEATFAGNVGDVYSGVFIFESGVQGTFAEFDLYIASRGLFLRPVYEGNSLGFQVVAIPAPSSIAFASLAGLFAARRRRSLT